MPPAVLLDSSCVIAWHNTRDVHHAAAARTMVQLLGGEWGSPLLLEYVLLEVVTVLRARRGHDVALLVADQLLGARELRFVSCSEFLLDTLDTFRREAADLSFTDAALVTVARKHKKGRIATFDSDFKGLAGITVVPAKRDRRAQPDTQVVGVDVDRTDQSGGLVDNAPECASFNDALLTRVDMLLPALAALLLVTSPQQQESVVPPPPREPLPRPVATALLAKINDNRTPAGKLDGRTLTLSLDVVEAAYQADGPADPVVRAFAFAEPGKAPVVPGPMLRASVGTTVRLTVNNRTDSALVLGGLRRPMPAEQDTAQLAAGATRTIEFTLTTAGNFFYWAALKGLGSYADRLWLDSQLTGALIVDAPGAGPRPNERVWLVTEWFQELPKTQTFESALTFNGKAWPYNERLTFTQNDSVHFRIVNAAAVEHPLHLHGFYFRVTRRGGERADTVVPPARQDLRNMHLIDIGGSLSLSFVPTTPGNWVFHCHFASHVGDDSSLHGSPDPYLTPATDRPHAVPEHDRPGGHTMRGLVIGMRVTPAPGYREPHASQRRTLNLLVQKVPNALFGQQTAYGFVLQEGETPPAADSILVPGPVLELKRGEPVRIMVQNRMDEPTGIHWHGLEIESFPDGVPGFSGINDRITPAIQPGHTFAAEFTPPRSGTFPYHAHLHELRQIGSGMYGAIIVSDTPRDTTRDHLVVAGGGGMPIFSKQSPTFLLVNGRRSPYPIRMVADEVNRLRLVSIHADAVLSFRFGSDTSVVRWTPVARDGADLPPALRVSQRALVSMGPGETADFSFVPARAGKMQIEVWIEQGVRIVVPVVVEGQKRGAGRR